MSHPSDLRGVIAHQNAFDPDDEADWRGEEAPFEYDGPSYAELKRLADG